MVFHDNQFHRAMWFDPISTDLKVFNPKRIAKIAKDTHATLVHFCATKPLTGEVLFKSKFQKMSNFTKGRDLLKEMVEESHKLGVKVSAYFNCHWVSDKNLPKNVEWLAKYADGKIHQPYYGAGFCPCMNSPEYIEYSVNLCKEMVTNYDIDGIFLDGPAIPINTCYCSHCKKKFKNLHGTALPTKAEWDKKIWSNFIEFRFNTMVEYLKKLHDSVREIREIPVYKNGIPLKPAWMHAINNELHVGVNDIIGGEHFVFYDNPLNTVTWGAGAAAKHFGAIARENPSMVYLCYPHKIWDFYPIPEADIKQIIACTIANGAWPNLTVDDYVTINDPLKLKPIKDMFTLIEKNENVFHAKSNAKVALYWSQVTSDYYVKGTVTGAGGTHDIKGIQTKKDYMDDVLGFYDMMVESHVPFDLIIDRDFEDGSFKKYECLILPNAACMNEKTAKSIADYVKQGGKIISTNEVSLYNMTGREREEFLLSNVLGVSIKSSAKIKEIESGQDYQTFEKVMPFTAGIDTVYIPAPVKSLRVKALKGSKTIGRFMNQLLHRYSPLQGISNYPSLVYNKFGKGESLYFAGCAGSLFKTFYIRDILKLFTNAIHHMVNLPVTVSGECDSSIELVTRKMDNGNLVLHLINWSSRIRRPVTSIVPLRDITVSVKTKEKPKSIKSIVSGKKFNYKIEKGNVTFNIPRLDGYDVIVVE